MNKREEFEKWRNTDIPQFNGELKNKDVDYPDEDIFFAGIEAATSSTTPDQAIQRALLEARIDECEYHVAFGHGSQSRLDAYRKQLSELGE